jgi:hypothetical protein
MTKPGPRVSADGRFQYRSFAPPHLERAKNGWRILILQRVSSLMQINEALTRFQGTVLMHEGYDGGVVGWRRGECHWRLRERSAHNAYDGHVSIQGVPMLQEEIEAFTKFQLILEWLLPVSARYAGSVQFGLALIDFENPKILGETYGAQRTAQKLNEISCSLRTAFRKTDLVARNGTDFWILAPYTVASEKLSDKIKDIIDVTSRNGLDIVERDISIFSLADHAPVLSVDPSPQRFLSYLKHNHAQFSRKKAELPASV